MRYLLIACLITGCSAGGSLTMPGKSPREAVLEKMRITLAAANLTTQSQKDCAINYINKALNDDEMRQVDAAIATGGTVPMWQTVVSQATSACIK